MAKKQRFDATAAEQQLRERLSEAQTLRDELLAKLGDGEDTTGELEALDEEIASHERTLKRFAEAKAATAKVDTAKVRAARHAAVETHLADGLADAEKLGAMCADVLLLLSELQGSLSAIEDQRAAVSAKFYDAAQDAGQGAPVERMALGIHETIRRAIHELTIPGAFIDAVWTSGLSRTGIHVSDDFIHVRPIRGDYSDTSGDVQAAICKLSDIAATLTAWSEKANGVKEKRSVAA